MHRLSVAVLAFLILASSLAQAVSAAPAAQQTQGSCLFFTETGGGRGGFAVCDDGQARFRTAFNTWGLQKIGYPISQRYLRDGFVTQAFQKAIMQWRAESNSVVLVNIFDDLHNAGYDATLKQTRQTPEQLPAGWDGTTDFAQIVKKRQALLDTRPALRSTYFASTEPLTFFGLPTSEVVDMGNHYAIRLQRAVLQEWKENVPWAKAGQVTIANGGDIAKELGSLPAPALEPQASATPNQPPVATTPGAPAPAPTQAAPAPTQPPAATATPAPTGAGGTVLLTSNRESYDDCYAMNGDGTNLRRLTTFGFCYDAHFTPDGARIVFSHNNNEGSFGDIWIMNADGSGQTNLTNTTDNIEEFPVVSPDGQKVAYLFGWPGGFEIYTMNLDGTDRKPLTSRNFDWMPTWSPNGQQVAFSSARGGSFNIWVINRDGTGLRQVTTFGRDRAAISPIFSPDGNSVAFSTIGANSPYEIWAVNLDGTNVRKLVGTVGNDPDNSTYLAAWKAGRFLVGGYAGNWDPYFVAEGSGTLQRVPLGDKDDKPTDWRP